MITKSSPEAGNAFFFVLLGVFLFAALMFTFSRSARQGGENISEKQMEIMATDIISYAQKIERVVSRARRRNVSENDISFENSFVAGYANGNCSVDKCKIFAGPGRASWQEPPQGANDASDWIFTGGNYVDGLGSAGDKADAELLMILPNLLRSVCLAINEYLGISDIPTESNGSYDSTLFTGLFGDPPDLINYTSGTASENGCFEGTGSTYHFYQVLIQRP